MSPSTQIYPFHPGKSLLLVCTERLTNPSWSFTWFLNGVEMNNTGLSHAVYNYDRKSYLNFQNLTKIIVDSTITIGEEILEQTSLAKPKRHTPVRPKIYLLL